VTLCWMVPTACSSAQRSSSKAASMSRGRRRRARFGARHLAGQDRKRWDVIVPFHQGRSRVPGRPHSLNKRPYRFRNPPCPGGCRASPDRNGRECLTGPTELSHGILHAADIKVPGTASAATMTMMETMGDRHKTLRWVVASALLSEWFTDSSSGNHVPVDQYPRAVNTGRSNCENIDWLSNR
jgi:hypothetical protein